jgi:hypothetical protein
MYPGRAASLFRVSVESSTQNRDQGLAVGDPTNLKSEQSGENLHCAAAFGASAIIGSRIVNVDPRSISLSTVM